MLVPLTKNVTFQNKYILSQVSVTAACLTIFILVKTTSGVLTSANTSSNYGVGFFLTCCGGYYCLLY